MDTFKEKFKIHFKIFEMISFEQLARLKLSSGSLDDVRLV